MSSSVPNALVLAIETSNPTSDPGRSAAVALARAGDDGNLVQLAATPLGEGERHGLLPSIDRCFGAAGLTPDALRAPGSRVAVSIGPGGYTSIRIAVTAAKMIAEATGAQCVPVPTAHVVAARATRRAAFVVALASKRETAWLTLFDSDGSERRVLGLVDHCAIDALSGEAVGTLVVDRFAPPLMVARAREAGMSVEPPAFDPLACATLGLALAPVEPLALLPLYPREPEAVTKWRTLKGHSG